MSQIISKIEGLITSELEERNIEIVDIQYRKEDREQIIRIFIDTTDGVNLETCATTTRIVRDIIDEKSDILYDHIEVSSPGLDRIIKKDKDFERFSGEKIRLRTLKPYNKQKNFIGILTGADDNHINIQVDEKVISIPRNIVSIVRLNPDL